MGKNLSDLLLAYVTLTILSWSIITFTIYFSKDVKILVNFEKLLPITIMNSLNLDE